MSLIQIQSGHVSKTRMNASINMRTNGMVKLVQRVLQELGFKRKAQKNIFGEVGDKSGICLTKLG